MVDVVKTRTDLIERAATEFGKLTSNETLADEDRDTIDELADPMFGQLSKDGVIDVADPEAIPSEYFLLLGVRLACEAAPSFGASATLLQNHGAASIDDLIQRVERKLRRLTAATVTDEPVRALYY